MADLPLIDASGLNRAQRLGRACASCGKRFPRPTVPVGRLGTGEILYRCTECTVVLEPAEPRAERARTAPPGFDRRP